MRLYQLLFIILCIISPITSLAQVEGVISYTEEIKNPRAEEIRTRMAERGLKVDIPDVNTFKMNLYFNSEESIYKKKEDKTEQYDGAQVGGGGSVMIRWGRASGGKNGYYRSIADGKILQEEDIMNKKFLITDEEVQRDWKITGRSEQLGNYQLIEAISINETDTIQAWFTPQIPVNTGPSEFSQLPGLILRIDVNHGNHVIYATNIDVRELTKEEQIEKPEKGKKVSYEEFDKIQKEKLEEMKKMYGEERAKRWMDH